MMHYKRWKILQKKILLMSNYLVIFVLETFIFLNKKLIKMKRITLLLAAFGLIIFLAACNSHSKSDTWSKEQETTWKKNCVELLMGNGEDKATAEDFCDCMYKKTSREYTPEEAAEITEEEERKLWQKCDYQW